MRTAASDACHSKFLYNPKKVYGDTEGISGQNEMSCEHSNGDDNSDCSDGSSISEDSI
jgi:hypothetical protein